MQPRILKTGLIVALFVLALLAYKTAGSPPVVKPAAIAPPVDSIIWDSLAWNLLSGNL